MPERLGLEALPPSAQVLHVRRRPGVVHLGLGAFHRSHQAWFTQRIEADQDPWGIVAFTGRRPDQAATLTAQQGVYTLITRSASGDEPLFVEAILAAHDGADVDAWRAAVAAPETAVITLTVTEAAYLRGPDGRVDRASPSVAADLAVLVGYDENAPCTTVPGRLVEGLRARLDAGAGPVAVVCCDNLTDNGRMVRDVVVSMAEAVGGDLADRILDQVSFVSSMVDRITPATTADDVATALELTGYLDEAVVVAEPFAEWVLSGEFPAGRPAWETAGARFVDDLEPYEHRKLWLLNGGHSLLAYLGLLLGHETIADAMADERCTTALEQLWDEAAAELPLPEDEIAEARAALHERFANPRIKHRLQQIAGDGSIKLPVRVVDPLRRRLRGDSGSRSDAGSRSEAEIGPGAATALAAWWLHLTRQADLVADPAASALVGGCTVSEMLTAIAPDLADRPDVVAAVEAAAAGILDFSPQSDPGTSTSTAPTTNTGVTA
jgi:fructuronate reductase